MVGQDGLSDGTPVRILARPGAEPLGAPGADGVTSAGRTGPPEGRRAPARER